VTEEHYPRLISLAVHELRTPIGVVAGYLRMLQRDSDGLTERQRKMIDEASKSCARVVALIAELSEVGKLDEGTIAMAQRPLDVFPLVAEVAASVHKAIDRAVKLDVQGLDAGAPMKGDDDRLRAAFAAVFQAILREKPEPATVAVDRRVVADAGRTSAVVVIADADGVQRAYEAPRAVFDERRGGVGMSLAIARRVIEAHGGTLWSPGGADARSERGAAVIALPMGVDS
jgi:signal transduction histidine kinase